MPGYILPFPRVPRLTFYFPIVSRNTLSFPTVPRCTICFSSVPGYTHSFPTSPLPTLTTHSTLLLYIHYTLSFPAVNTPTPTRLPILANNDSLPTLLIPSLHSLHPHFHHAHSTIPTPTGPSTRQWVAVSWVENGQYNSHANAFLTELKEY